MFNEWVAELKAAIKETRGDSEMNEWTVVPPTPEPLPSLKLKYAEGITATATPNGCVEIKDEGNILEFVATCDIRKLIASLQSILVLAEEHFGEDWGKE